MFLFVPGVISQQTDADCGEDVHTGNRMLRLLPKVTRQRMGRPWSEVVCYCSVDFVVLRLVQVNELNCVFRRRLPALCPRKFGFSLWCAEEGLVSLMQPFFK